MAGGISKRDCPLETIIREAQEEASLEAEIVESRIRAAGLISYTRRDEKGWM